jgi:hypothetical protein
VNWIHRLMSDIHVSGEVPKSIPECAHSNRDPVDRIEHTRKIGAVITLNSMVVFHRGSYIAILLVGYASGMKKRLLVLGASGGAGYVFGSTAYPK